MPIFISSFRLTRALQQLGHSRAKRSALFDFLIVKRALAIKNQDSVAITETEPAFISALDEIAGCGEFDGKLVKPETPYLNFFALREKDKQGYRPIRYRSNGTNSTIGGSKWRSVIQLSEETPRKAKLADGYIDHLSELVLSSSHKDPKPNINEAAIWYHRGKDVESLLSGSTDEKDRIAKLTQNFIEKLKLSANEISVVFSTEIEEVVSKDAPNFVNERPHPLDYLPSRNAITSQIETVLSDGCSLDLVLALTAKNFVILTGPSGTGKSRTALKLVEGLQYHYSDKVDGSIFELIPVGPDWTTPKRLLGYKTPFGSERVLADGTKTHESFEITDTIRLILRASHPDVADIPHFLIFDEMNLSHVERYFSPFLSLMEASNILDEENGVSLIDSDTFRVVAEVLQNDAPNSREAEAAQMLLADERSFVLPPNLFFVGTVNVDETTYMFSPKVLDRAHVLELASERPSSYIIENGAKPSMELINVALADKLLQIGIESRESRKNEFLNPSDIINSLSSINIDDNNVNEIKKTVIKALDGCYDLLSPIGFPFGYRISKEVFVYIWIWFSAQNLIGRNKDDMIKSWPVALDRAILQKVLPKIHGNKRLLGDSLRALSVFLGGGHIGTNPPASYVIGAGTSVSISENNKLALSDDHQMEKSRKKLDTMSDRLNATGYVSFVS